MDRNHFNNFERGPTKDHSCEVWSKSNHWFRRRCCLKIVNGRMDRRRPDLGSNTFKSIRIQIQILCNFTNTEYKYKYIFYECIRMKIQILCKCIRILLNTFQSKWKVYIINGGIIQNKKHLRSHQLLFVISNYNKHNILKLNQHMYI